MFETGRWASHVEGGGDAIITRSEGMGGQIMSIGYEEWQNSLRL